MEKEEKSTKYDNLVKLIKWYNRQDNATRLLIIEDKNDISVSIVDNNLAGNNRIELANITSKYVEFTTLKGEDTLRVSQEIMLLANLVQTWM